MNNIINNYLKFNVLGLEKDIVTEDDKKLIKILENRLQYFKKINPDYIVITTYKGETQEKIFNELKKRQGDKTRITFLNDKGVPVEITHAKYIENKGLILNCVFCKSRKYFSMWLWTFLKEYKAGNITKVEPKKFADNYFVTVSEFLVKTEAELKTLKEKYNKVYKDTESSLKASYDAEVAKYAKVEKESKKSVELTSEEALEKAQSFKGLERIKDYWNTRLAPEEKDALLDWISKNIYSIRVYGLLNGRSGNTLLNEYNDIGDVKYREILRDDEGKVTSQDSIVAHISFKNIVDAPIEILKKVVSTKRRSENIFYKNRLNDKNLALFLLSEYHDKGFKAGVRNLYKELKGEN